MRHNLDATCPPLVFTWPIANLPQRSPLGCDKLDDVGAPPQHQYPKMQSLKPRSNPFSGASSFSPQRMQRSQVLTDSFTELPSLSLHSLHVRQPRRCPPRLSITMRGCLHSGSRPFQLS